MIKISAYYEDKLVTEFEQASRDDIAIGRAAGCTIQLDEPSISRLHAVIRYRDGAWVLERRANFGAVLLNGNEVENAHLEGGEEISIGNFSLRVNVEETGAQAASSGFSQEQMDYLEDSGERTRLVSTAAVNATFRFEPGSANVAEFLMDKDVAVFGRGSNCDVVLMEKKASRKHCEIRKQGLSFFIKDLNSANGMLVNGAKVTEAELVPGDVIQIGESKIQFIVENKDYFSRQDQFMPVPAHLEQGALVDTAFPPPAEGIPGIDPSELPGAAADGMHPAEPELSSTDFIGKAKRAWSKIPKAQRMRYLTILVVAALVMAVLGEPDQPKKPPPKRPNPTGSQARTIEHLPEERKKFVRDNYERLLKANENKEYSKMLEHTGHILTYVDEYRDTKLYETMAKKALDELEEIKRKAELEKKLEATRAEVKALEEKGKPVYERALNDVRHRTELDGIIQDIFSKDPNNRLAQEWRDGIRRKDQQDKEEAEAARVKEERRQVAEGQMAAVKRTFESGKFVQALAEADKLSDNGWYEDGYPERVEELKSEIRGKLSSVIDPLLRQAANERQDGGDLIKANQLYNEVLKVDGSNRDALNGKSAIREILHLRAKRLYAEAVLAESINDLTEAKEKFEKCFKTAADEDSYKRKCRQKAARFEYFNNAAGSF